MPATEHYDPSRVIQIVSSSRSGSSLLKKLLSKSPSVTALDGEEEPYFAMSGNGYGYTSNSDAFSTIVCPNLFRAYIATEINQQGLNAWEWRLRLQYANNPILPRLLNDLESLLKVGSAMDWLRRHGVWGHYDGCSPHERLPITSISYEMPPYIIPSTSRNITTTLLLKCPYNTYRPGLMESVYPNAQFTYICIHRNPAATINGLIDGWEASYGFHKHMTPYGWWKFDMPPNWEEIAPKGIPQRAYQQWLSSCQYMEEHWKWKPDAIDVKFEGLIGDPAGTIGSLCCAIDIEPPPLPATLPLTMASNPPEPSRWKRRANIIEPMLANGHASHVIKHLRYADRRSWV